MSKETDYKRSQRLKSLENNKDHSNLEAAALRYESSQDNAPKMVAHGKGHAAKKILQLAEEHDLPITKDPTLVSILGALEVGAEIPPDLYGVIAEVLAWAYRADKQASHKAA